MVLEEAAWGDCIRMRGLSNLSGGFFSHMMGIGCSFQYLMCILRILSQFFAGVYVLESNKTWSSDE